jgi:hypothetical protein
MFVEQLLTPYRSADDQLPARLRLYRRLFRLGLGLRLRAHL